MGISAALGAHQQALGALIGVIRPREITAGIEPARRNGKVATLTVGLGHDVSTVLGTGRQRGSQPREHLDHDHAGAAAWAWATGRGLGDILEPGDPHP